MEPPSPTPFALRASAPPLEPSSPPRRPRRRWHPRPAAGRCRKALDALLLGGPAREPSLTLERISRPLEEPRRRSLKVGFAPRQSI
eukprot:12435067-Alexandrium_andersonii.AAC.1